MPDRPVSRVYRIQGTGGFGGEIARDKKFNMIYGLNFGNGGDHFFIILIFFLRSRFTYRFLHTHPPPRTPQTKLKFGSPRGAVEPTEFVLFQESIEENP